MNASINANAASAGKIDRAAIDFPPRIRSQRQNLVRRDNFARMVEVVRNPRLHDFVPSRDGIEAQGAEAVHAAVQMDGEIGTRGRKGPDLSGADVAQVRKVPDVVANQPVDALPLLPGRDDGLVQLAQGNRESSLMVQAEEPAAEASRLDVADDGYERGDVGATERLSQD